MAPHHSQRSFDLLLKTFLLLSPVFFFRAYYPSFAKGMFFVFGSFALFAVSLAKEPLRKFSNPWLSGILLLAFIRIFFGCYYGTSDSEWFNFWLSAAGFIYVLSGVLLFYTVYCHAENIKQYFFSIAVVCVMNFILVFSQIMGYDFFYARAPSISGFMETSTQLGQYSALALPIIFFIAPILAIIPLVTLLVSGSISPILASVIGMAFIGGFKGRILIIKIIVGILLSLVFAFNFDYVTAKFKARPVMWQKTLKVALQRPYLGWGYQSFPDQVLKVKGENMGAKELSRPHNDFIHTAQELGFPIVICIVLFFANIFKSFFTVKNKDKLISCLVASVIIVLVNMSGQTLIRYASITGTFIVILALLCAKLKEVQIAGSV